MWRFSLLLISVGSLVAVPGCGQSGQSSRNDGKAHADHTASTPPHTSDTSQVRPPVALPVKPDSPPEAVVGAFLDALREGDEGVAAGLLTAIAREETARHDLEVRPPGTPAASYEIGQVQLVQGGAHVASIWSEPTPDGDRVAYEVVWVLRQQPDGWRIAGMATELVRGQPPVFLNFEDLADMFQKTEQAEAMLAAEHEQPAASNAAAPPASTGGRPY